MTQPSDTSPTRYTYPWYFRAMSALFSVLFTALTVLFLVTWLQEGTQPELVILWLFFAAASLFLGARWAPAFTLWVATVISAWYWADRLLLAHSDYARVTRPAAAFVNLVLLAWIFWSLRGLQQRGALSEGGR